MSFHSPPFLWIAAAALPLLALALWWSARKARALAAQFIPPRLLDQLTEGINPRRRRFRAACLLAGISLILVALARPQWGFAWEEARQKGLDILVAIDTSRSMLATDITPSRIARAKLAALDLLRIAKTDRLGLIAFAGTSFLQCPLTLDDHAFRESINTLDVGIMPQGGSSLAAAIKTATESFAADPGNFRILVLFSDGEDHEEGAVAAAQAAAAAGIKIFTVGVGTPAGELLRARTDKGGSDWVRDPDGNVVKSKLNEPLLREIATLAGGFYLPLQNPKTIETLYQQGIDTLPKSEFQSRMVQRHHERYQWPLALAWLLLAAELLILDRRGRRRPPALRPAPLALALCLLAPSLGLASSSTAQRDYRQGRFRDAFYEYRRLQEQSPNDPRLHYNAGVAAYRAGKFSDAASEFEASTRAPDLKLQQQSYYNRGTSLFKAGEVDSEPPARQKTWEDALQSLESAVRLDPKDEDARVNRDWVKERLEELKRQNPPPQDQKDSKDDKNSPPKDKDSSKDQQKNPKNSKASNEPDQKPENQDNQKQQESQDSKQPPDDKPGPDKPNPGDTGKDGQPSPQQKPPEQAANPPGQPEPKDDDAADAASAALGQMTPQQARQLLDAQKGEERAMMFIPKDKKRDASDRTFKDW